MASGRAFLSTLRSSNSIVNGARQLLPAGGAGGRAAPAAAAPPRGLWPPSGGPSGLWPASGALLPASLSPEPYISYRLGVHRDAPAGGGGSAGGAGSGGAGAGGGGSGGGDRTAPAAPPLATPAASSSERALVSQLLGQIKRTAEVRQYLKVCARARARTVWRRSGARAPPPALTTPRTRASPPLPSLQYYGSVASQRFAIVRVSGDVLTSPGETAAVAAALAFLHRLGLVPVVVHGAGLFTGRRSGDVAAAADVTAAAHAHMLAANAALVAALRKEGVEAAPFTSGVFSASRQAPGRGAYGASAELAPIAGDIQGVASELLSAAAGAGRIPIVAALAAGGGAGGGSTPFLSFPTLDACGALARALRPLKVIWLRPEGGLRAADGEATVRALDLAADGGAAAAIAAGLQPRDAALLPGLRALYEAVAGGGAAADSAGASVSVTKPEHLAAELLSPGGGSGTVLLRRERIRAVTAGPDAAAQLDLPRIAALIQEAFGAALPAGYVADLVAGTAPGRALRRIYVSESYRGVAFVTEEAGMPGVAYLDKFAVARSAQGDRLGETLWRAMLDAEADTLYWRSRSANTVNPWYFEQAHGALKAGDWTVFWRGLPADKVMPAVATALALKPTFPLRVYPQGRAATAEEAAEQPQLK